MSIISYIPTISAAGQVPGISITGHLPVFSITSQLSVMVTTYRDVSDGLIIYRKTKGIYQYTIDLSDDGGVTWELNLVTLYSSEDSIVITIDDSPAGYRDLVRNGAYVIDQELTETGFEGTEGIDWENIYSTQPTWIAFSDAFGTSAANTAYENSAIINALVADGIYTKIVIGNSATDTYLISQPICPDNIEIQYNCILKMMDSVTDPLAANILVDATTFTATDASKFHVGEFVAVTDDDQLVTYEKLRGWGGKITDITGNVITLDTKAPYAYTAANNGIIATLQSVILINQGSNVTIDQAGGYIDGNRAGQSLIHPTYKTTGVVEGYTQACGISVFKSSYITITDNVVVRNASMHGISFSSESTADLNQYLTIGAVHVYDSSEKGMHFKWTAHGTLGNAVVDTCTWEDGIIFYSTNTDWVVGDVTTIDCGRSGFIWNAASSGLTFSSVTTSGCTDFGFDCASKNVIGGSVVTSDRVRFNQTSPAGGGCTNVVIDSIAITGSISAITTPVVWLYGGIDGVTIGSLTLNGCTGIGIRASVLSTLYPQNVVVNAGGIYTHTGAKTDIQVGSDVTLTGDFT